MNACKGERQGIPRRCLFLFPIGTCQTDSCCEFALKPASWSSANEITWAFLERKKTKLSRWSRDRRVRTGRRQPEKWPWMQPRWFYCQEKKKSSPPSLSSSSTSCSHKVYFVFIVAIHRLLHCTVYQNVRCCDHSWPWIFFSPSFFLF